MKLILRLLLSLTFSGVIGAQERLSSFEFFIYSQSKIERLTFQNWQNSPKTDDWQICSVPVHSHYLHITGPYRYKGPKELIFFDAASAEKRAALRLNTYTPTTLFIFLDNLDYGIKSEALRYDIVSFALNPRRQAAGQLNLLNLSGFQLIVKVNSQILDLKSNSGLSCQPESQVRLQIALAGPRNEWIVGWKKSFLLAQHSAQALIIFPPSLPGSSQLDIRRIELQVPALPEANK